MKLQALHDIIAGFMSASKINQNFERITAAFQNTISRDGSTPNNMQAELDMGGKRVINVGTPADPNDAVRLRDIIDLSTGEINLSQDYNDLVNVPTQFPPSSHYHSSTDIPDLGEFVEDKIGSKIVAGPNITVSYNDTTGDTTISGSGSVGTAWTSITGKPSTFTPSAHTHVSSEITDLQEYVEDRIGAVVAGGTGISTSYNDSTGVTTISYTGSVSSGGFPTLEDFGGVGDNATDNATAIAAAMASTAKRVYLNGTYYTTSTSNVQLDRFFGPGKFRFNSSWRPARTVTLTSLPTQGTGGGLGYFYSGDISKVDVEHWNLGQAGNNFRIGVNQPYFESVTTPKYTTVQSFLGYSGLTARTTSSVSTGATTVNLDLSASGGDDLPAGRTFVFSSDMDGSVLHTATSSGVSGSTLSFSPSIPSGVTIPAGSVVYVGKRTHTSLHNTEFTHNGGGDSYIYMARNIAQYQPTKGQKHFFNTSTIGLFGGDLTCVYDGNFMTGIEINHDGGATDCAATGLILNFQRNNDTGARGVSWSGITMKSEGTKAMNSAISAIGKFNVGLDLSVYTDFGTNRGAIGMKLGDRIHFNMSPTDRGGVALVGDTYPASPMYIGSDTVSGVKVVEMYNGLYRLRLQENGGLTTNASFTTAGNVTAGGNFSVNGGSVFLGTDGSKLVNTGSSIQLWKGGSLVATW